MIYMSSSVDLVTCGLGTLGDTCLDRWWALVGTVRDFRFP